ncbi:MAG: hypothetical protein IH818_05190 [Acidobacteria bacterium]|nr:hypothetical protein [Acidobacteriota bacterium]
MSSFTGELLGPLQGARILGGCDLCNAIQVVQPTAMARGIWYLTVYHDDSLPTPRDERDATW